MSPKLARALFVAAAVSCALVVIKVLPTTKFTRPEPPVLEENFTRGTAEASKSDQHRNAEYDTARSIDSKIKVGGTATIPAVGAPNSVSSSTSVAKWTLIMNETKLPLIGSDPLRLTEAAVALMELSPEQARTVNLAIDRFIERLRADEIANAYVSIDPSGKEQIVVRPFDRKETIEAFRSELQTVAGINVAQFLGNQATFNPTLAAGNWEMRAYVEHTPGGKDGEVFVRTLEMPVITVDGRDLPPYIRMTSKSSLGSDPRSRHLFEAMKRLPRVGENPTLPKSAQLSNPVK